MGRRVEKEPSEVLSEFLAYIDRIRYDYKAAHDAVKKEEKRLQDLLHDIEFAEGENEKRRAGTRLQQSRRNRRRKKDEMMRLELVVQFFDEPTQKSTINKMRQLLGKQRKVARIITGFSSAIDDRKRTEVSRGQYPSGDSYREALVWTDKA